MRIAVSGTYSTGKTTTALALSFLTGMPLTHARTMREILPVAFPGKVLEKCLFHELLELGIRRFSERVVAETSMQGGFISDGCSLQEWIYGTTRKEFGANPSENFLKMKLRKLVNPTASKVFEETITAFGQVVKDYARTHYDLFIHLPVEFPFVRDGHRPTSETFRVKSESLLKCTYEELEIKPLTVSGSLEERLLQIISHLDIAPKISVEEAVALAYEIKQAQFDSIKLESY